MEWRNLRAKEYRADVCSEQAPVQLACNDVAPRVPPSAPIEATVQGAPERAGESARGRLLVISHPSVVSVNQEVYRELMRRGWDVQLVLPSRWRSEYDERDFAPQVLPGMERALVRAPVVLRGYPQRHLYLARCHAIAARFRPDVAFVEAEPFSFAAAQWSLALGRLGVPFGVQCAENIDRRLPLPVRWTRSRVLRRAAFVAARSESAGRLARTWGARGEVELAPHAVPGWEDVPGGAHGAPGAGGERDEGASPSSRPFTVGYAGRLVPSKGLGDLLAAMRRLEAPVELLLIGDGKLRGELEGQAIPGSKVRVLDDLGHEQMAAGYARLDVLALPSLTTPTWKEQFGRVIVEALWCGVPVVGSDSGEIPWLIELTGGGLTFPEGDSAALAERLARLREDPALRARLAAAGRAKVEQLFTVSAATDPLERMIARAAGAKRGSTDR
jgi:glycosyltransferase involved in cell wall biosynthesis